MLQVLLKQPEGAVGKNLRKRANVVLAAARLQVGVDTGRLKASLRIQSQERDVRGQFVKVGSKVDYALMHHNEIGRAHV